MVFGQKNNKFSSKKAEESSEVTEAPVFTKAPTEEPADLNSTGFSMIRHPEGGFAIVILKFNPVTMLAKVDNISRRIESRMETEDEFKMIVGRYFAEQESKS